MNKTDKWGAVLVLACIAAGCANPAVPFSENGTRTAIAREVDQGPTAAADQAAKQERYRKRLREYEERKARERAEKIEAARLKELAIQEEYRKKSQSKSISGSAQPEIPDRERRNTNDKSILFSGLLPEAPKRIELTGTAFERETMLNSLPASENQATFADAALHDPFGRVRFAAVRKLQDPHVLAEIATSGDEPYIRAEAIRKINDRSILAKLADGPSALVRKAARKALGLSQDD